MERFGYRSLDEIDNEDARLLKYLRIEDIFRTARGDYEQQAPST